ncbi:MAG: class I SAM-dependent methyltransferase [Actinomycetia bacterium]|nr:class I SAM-dependent methyltransferase [Actinomycetes bacterium]
MSRWMKRDDVMRGATYDTRWDELVEAGENVHGEADLIQSLLPIGVESPIVMDAGCGTGRVAIELAGRGVDVVGVDVDPQMLEQAKAKAPHLEWILDDLTHVGQDRSFDIIALPGNVMIFVEHDAEAAVVANLAAHLTEGGLLVAGFVLEPEGLTVDGYDRCCEEAGLSLVDRWATWDKQPFDGDDYAVSVHRR